MAGEWSALQNGWSTETPDCVWWSVTTKRRFYPPSALSSAAEKRADWMNRAWTTTARYANASRLSAKPTIGAARTSNDSRSIDWIETTARPSNENETGTTAVPTEPEPFESTARPTGSIPAFVADPRTYRWPPQPQTARPRPRGDSVRFSIFLP